MPKTTWAIEQSVAPFILDPFLFDFEPLYINTLNLCGEVARVRRTDIANALEEASPARDHILTFPMLQGPSRVLPQWSL